ncbi:MAG: hypothetical protein KF858_05805 [Candidatus Sumerlaeia bacterium]|nr:hypothetical protein [Candidatus Sumerlaeia bacterium]
MSTITHPWRNAILAVGVLAAAGYSTFHFTRPAPTRSATYEQMSQAEIEERTAAYKLAVAKADELVPNWPANEQVLIVEFWRAVAAKDFDKACVLCPGSKPDDFAMFAKWTPEAPKAIGRPGPHPTKPEVLLWPVTVPFPGFPNKTIKMAVRTMEDGRLAIDGQHTIWW